MTNRPVVIIAVERGWQRSRGLSLDLMRKGCDVDILIKGFVEKPVLDMITKYPSIKITSVSRFWFRVVLFLKIAALKKIAFGDNFKRFSVVRKVFYTFLHHKNLKAVYVEGKKIEKWLFVLSRCFGLKVFLVDNESCAYL